jgi:hypothetical protein
MSTQEISKEEGIKKILEIPYEDSRMFSVIFTKKDGSRREMLCRRGVKKGVTGKGMAYNPADYKLLPVFDMQKHKEIFPGILAGLLAQGIEPAEAEAMAKEESAKKSFRMVNAQTLIQLKIGGETFTVKQESA